MKFKAMVWTLAALVFGGALSAQVVCRPRYFGDRPQTAAKLAQVVPSETSFAALKKKWLARGETYTNRVDILVAYDTTGAAWARENYGTDGLVRLAEESVAKMNFALSNSGLGADHAFALVGTEALTFNAQTVKASAGGSTYIDYDRLLDLMTENTAPVWKQLRQAREDASADIVVVLVDNGESFASGMISLGYQLDYVALQGVDNFADYAYCICSIRDVAAGHTMTHEVGHLMGAGHGDSSQMNPNYWVVGPQLFNDSAAHYFTSGDGMRYFTVMGYNWDGYMNSPYCLAAPCFSTPDQTDETGVAVGSERHNNARTLHETFAIAANYRPHQVRLAVDVPSGGGVVTGGGTYPSGRVVGLQAKAKSGYVFAGWYTAYDAATGAYAEPLRGSLDYRTPTVGYVVPLEDLTLYARFLRASEDRAQLAVVCEPDAAGYEAGVALKGLKLTAVSGSMPTLTVKNLPAGLKFDAKTGTVVGTPTKPGVYTVSVSAKNLSGATVTDTVTIVVRNFTDPLVTVSEDLPNGLQDAYGPFVPGVPVDLTVPPLVGWTASGLPAGLKFDKLTGRIAGIPTKPGTLTATFKASLRDEVLKKNVAHTATATFSVGDYPTMPVMVVQTAPADPSADRVLVPGETLTLMAGVRQRFTLAAEGLDGTPTTFAAKNLPAGLKLVKTPLKNEKNAITNYAFTVEGVPTAASKMKNGAVVPSAVQLTASNKYKWSGTFACSIVVEPLPAWAVGTFEGYAAGLAADETWTKGPGFARLTAAVGKLSGKYALNGTNWTVTATGYTSYEAGSDTTPPAFVADAVAKSGKLTLALTLRIVPGFTTDAGDFTLCASAQGTADDVRLTLARNAWKDKILTPAFPKAAQPLADFPSVTVKTSAAGKVTFAGKLDDGTRVSSSISAVYRPDGSYGAWFVVPVSKTFGGSVAWVALPVLGD